MNIGIGHNSLLSEEALLLTVGDLSKRLAELGGVVVPDKIGNDTEKGAAADVVKLINAALKAAEAKRQEVKEPYLTAGKLIDGVFSKLVKGPENVKVNLLTVIGDYDRERAAAIRRAAQQKAEEEQKRAAEELAAAQALEASGFNAGAAQALDAAAEAETQSLRARETATADTAELTRVRSTGYGALATTRKSWTFEVVSRADLDLNALRPYIAADALDKAIAQFVRAGNRSLSGVRIYEKETTVVS